MKTHFGRMSRSFYAHMFMGDCLEQLKRYDEAISELQETLRITPKNTAVMARLGNVLGRVGRKREALELLKQMEQVRQSEYTAEECAPPPKVI